MSQSRLFVQLSVGLVLIAAGVGASCRIELSPSSVVVRYGDPVLVNCTTTVSHDGMGWEASQGGIGNMEVDHLAWKVENLTEWDISPSCYINPKDSDQCQENLNIVVYTFPEKIKINSTGESNGMMVEGKEYNIICEIPKIAPVQNLTVKWYKGDRIIEPDILEIIEPNHLKNTKQPVKLLSTFPFTPTRKDSGTRFRCEAQMDLSPVGPHFNVSSQEFSVTVVFGPDVQCSNLIELMENESLEENCNITGNPTPSVKWLKDEQLFNSTTPMRRENAGMYTLEANGRSSVQKNIQVHVLYGPELNCPSIYIAEEHTPHNLTCTVEGFPEPDTVWYKDDKVVELPKTLLRDDAGHYLITASNSQSNVNTTVEIIVHYQPSEIFELQDIQVHLGSTVELKCSSSGNPRPTYSWNYYQTDNVMEENEDGVSRLEIHSTTAYNMGSYTCHARNNKGSISKTIRVTVIGAEQECPLEITPNPMVLEYRSRAQGATCRSTSTISTNVQRMYWEGVESDNMTWFANTNEDWGMTPVCTASFRGIGKCNKSLNFTLYKKPDSVSIYHVDRLSYVEEGEQFQLRCDIVSVAPAQNLTVLWYKNQDILEETDCQLENNKTCKLSDVRSPVNVSATINVNLQRKDGEAEFRCEARLNLRLNPLPTTTSSTLKITVLYKPKINTTKLPKEIPVFRGYSEELVCEAEGYPIPKIQWHYNPESHVNVSKGKLTVSEPGIYNCTASNDVGSASHVVEVILKEKPVSVSINHVDNFTSVEEGKEFQLRCEIVNVAPEQNLTVLWYKNQDKLGKTHCQLENNKTCKFSDVRPPVNVSATINVSLQRNNSGAEFRCEALLDTGSNTHQNTTSSALNITVLYKPKINTTKLPKEIPVFRGYPEELVCEADGNPIPKIQWHYNPESHVNVSKGNLTVYGPGIYNCTASNDVGSASYEVKVILKEDYLPLIAGFVAVTVVAISTIFVFIYSIYYKNTKMRRYSLKNPKFSAHNGNVAHSNGDLQFPMTRLSKQYICA
ncbi:hemicentin-1 isoform X1 [Oreochromis aureus]|uniref:Ig-like domain-containing protein n=1 Tax=Oreochromis aureus TaxID=47969 RepID=A0AAZ1XVJ3_OREAU|nr:hemicentin-1 isoform X1 [Oreochromis aureus]